MRKIATRSHSENVEAPAPSEEGSAEDEFEEAKDDPSAEDVSDKDGEDEAVEGQESSLQGEIQDAVIPLWEKLEEVQDGLQAQSKEQGDSIQALRMQVAELTGLVQSLAANLNASKISASSQDEVWKIVGRGKSTQGVGAKIRVQDSERRSRSPSAVVEDGTERRGRSLGAIHEDSVGDGYGSDDNKSVASVFSRLLDDAGQTNYANAARKSFGKLPESLQLREWPHEPLDYKNQPKAPVLSKAGKIMSKEDILKFCEKFVAYKNAGGSLNFWRIVVDTESQISIFVLLFPGKVPALEEMRDLSTHELLKIVHEKCGNKSKFDAKGDFMEKGLLKIGKFNHATIDEQPEETTASFVSGVFTLAETAASDFGITEVDVVKQVLAKKLDGNWQMETKIQKITNLGDLFEFVQSKAQACIIAKKYLSDYGIRPGMKQERDQKEKKGLDAATGGRGSSSAGSSSEKKKCFICQSPDHVSKDCPLKSKEGEQRTCWGCGNTGHARAVKQSNNKWVITCPKKDDPGFVARGPFTGKKALAIPSISGESKGLPFNIYSIVVGNRENLHVAFGADSLSASSVVSVEQAAILETCGAVITSSTATLQVAGDNCIRSKGQIRFELSSVECPGVVVSPITVTAEILEMPSGVCVLGCDDMARAGILNSIGLLRDQSNSGAGKDARFAMHMFRRDCVSLGLDLSFESEQEKSKEPYLARDKLSLPCISQNSEGDGLCLTVVDMAHSDAVEEEISRAHASVAVCHGGVARTLREVQKNNPNTTVTRRQVRLFIQRCAICQRNQDFIPSAVGGQQKISGSDVGAQLAGDLCVNFPVGDNLYHVLTFVETHSGEIFLSVLPDKTAKSVAVGMVKVISRVGRFPNATLVTDKGGEFCSEVSTEVQRLLGLNSYVITPTKHGANGMAEVRNRSISTFIRNYTASMNGQASEDLANFEVAVALAELQINTSVMERYGLAPWQITRPFNGENLGWQFKEDFAQKNPEGTTLELSKFIEKAAIEASFLMNKRRWEAYGRRGVSSETPIIYKPGDAVLLHREDDRRENKFGFKVEGPFKVVRQSGASVEICDLNSKKDKNVRKVPIYRLKHFYHLKGADLQALARTGSGEFEVENIVRWRVREGGKPKNKSDYEWLVKWRHYADSYNSWIGWSEARLLEALQNFIDDQQSLEWLRPKLERAPGLLLSMLGAVGVPVQSVVEKATVPAIQSGPQSAAMTSLLAEIAHLGTIEPGEIAEWPSIYSDPDGTETLNLDTFSSELFPDIMTSQVAWGICATIQQSEAAAGYLAVSYGPDLTAEELSALKAEVYANRDLYEASRDPAFPSRTMSVRLKLGAKLEDLPKPARRKYDLESKRIISERVALWESQAFIRRVPPGVQPPTASACYIVPGSETSLGRRVVVDFKAGNLHLHKPTEFYPADVSEFLLQTAGKKKFGKSDIIDWFGRLNCGALTQADEQKEMETLGYTSRSLTTFIDPEGNFYEFNRVPQGLVCSAQHAQEMSRLLFGDKAYQDDIISSGVDFDDYLRSLQEQHRLARLENVHFSGKKSFYGFSELEIVGLMTNGEQQWLTEETRFNASLLSRPLIVSELRHILGVYTYMSQFVKNFAILRQPFNNSCATNRRGMEKLIWTPELITAWDTLSAAVSHSVPLAFPDGDSEYFVITDASNGGIGAMLFKRKRVIGASIPLDPLSDPTLVLVALGSMAFKLVQLRWSTIEQECFGIFWALRKFRHILLNSDFTVYCDHRNLSFLLKSESKKLTNWRLALQEFSFKVVHIAGAANWGADVLSRLHRAVA